MSEAANEVAEPGWLSQRFSFRLPASDREIALKPATGVHDLLLLEHRSCDTKLAIALAGALAQNVEGTALDWGDMCITDLDACILNLRRATIGNYVRASVNCPSAGCGKRIDIQFTVDQFLAHQFPSRRRVLNNREFVKPSNQKGWYFLGSRPEGDVCEFRLPTPNDQLAVAGSTDPGAELETRCLRPANVSARCRRRAIAAISSMAPCLSCDLWGTCPECGATTNIYFDARSYCLRELRNRAAFLYEDVDVLARRYHWLESDILAMPQSRRDAYVELARRVQEN